jgi:hypothetical protein
MNDLTAPLGRDPRKHQHALTPPVGQIIAVALGLFAGAFVLWAVMVEDRSGGEPIAVVPADLHIAKKAPEVIAVPQEPAPPATTADAGPPATTATLPPSAPVKSPRSVTVTIVDGKTGTAREVVVAVPSEPADRLAPQR